MRFPEFSAAGNGVFATRQQVTQTLCVSTLDVASVQIGAEKQSAAAFCMLVCERCLIEGDVQTRRNAPEATMSTWIADRLLLRLTSSRCGGRSASPTQMSITPRPPQRRD